MAFLIRSYLQMNFTASTNPKKKYFPLYKRRHSAKISPVLGPGVPGSSLNEGIVSLALMVVD